MTTYPEIRAAMEAKAEQVYGFIVDHKRRHDGLSPTLRQIVAAGLASSTSQAASYLLLLEQAGRIRRARGAARAEVVGGRWSPPKEEK